MHRLYCTVWKETARKIKTDLSEICCNVMNLREPSRTRSSYELYEYIAETSGSLRIASVLMN
jgi:hypothetical protein